MKHIFVIFLCCILIDLNAQERVDATGLSFNLNSSLKVNPQYSLKPAIKGRYVSLFDKTEGIEDVEENSQRIDLQLALEKRLNSSAKLAVGAMYRFNNSQNATRIFQQIGWVKNSATKPSFIHRVKSDQTIRDIDDIEVRVRYRFGISLPLQGFKLNTNEKYLVAYTEVLGKHRISDFSNELRLKITIGQLLKGGSKAELGIDFRYDNPFEGIGERLYLLDFAYYFSLK